MKLNNYIDHTILKADATTSEVIKLCDEAKQYNFASVCVNTCFAETVSRELRDTNVKTCVVVGFPLGAMATQSKAYEAKLAVQNGAQEVDMVINVGALKEKNYEFVLQDIKSVVNESRPAIVKVIIETCLLTNDEKVKACELSVLAGADFVKTSTGFSTGGATVEDIALMRKTVGPNIGVKASGGVKTKTDTLKMIEAGASRVGASASIAIVTN